MAKSKKQKKKQQKKQAKKIEKEIFSLLDTEIGGYGGILGGCMGCAEEAGLFDFLTAEDTGKSVAIHFLPHMINLYVSERGNLHATDGTVCMVDENSNNFIEINGTIVMLEIADLFELEAVKERYRLNDMNVPVVMTRVRPIN